MALWQYTFQVLTKDSYEFLCKDFLQTLGDDNDDFNFDPFWQYRLIHKSYFEEISTFLKKGKSWSNNIDLYGNQESNCFEVLFDIETNIVESVSFRIDYTHEFEDLLIHLIEFCLLKGLVVLDENLNVALLNTEVLKSIIENAPQVKKYNMLLNGKTL